MTILQTAPQIRLDGLVLATYAQGLANVSGLDVLAPRRASDQTIAYMPGVEEYWDDPPGAKVRTFQVWVTPYDDDGNVTYAGGQHSHQRDNNDRLMAIIGKTGSPIAVEFDVQLPGGGVETRAAEGKVIDGAPVAGSRLRSWLIRVMFPFPFWNVQPQVTGVSPGAVATGGGARIHDIVATFTAAGTLENSDTGRILTASGACVVDVRRRLVTVGGNPAPNLITPSHPDWIWLEPNTTNTIAGSNVTFAYYNARE